MYQERVYLKPKLWSLRVKYIDIYIKKYIFIIFYKETLEQTCVFSPITTAITESQEESKKKRLIQTKNRIFKIYNTGT